MYKKIIWVRYNNDKSFSRRIESNRKTQKSYKSTANKASTKANLKMNY